MRLRMLAYLCMFSMLGCVQDETATEPVTEPPLQFVLSWGSEGSGDGQFDRPEGIAVSVNGDVFVADYHNHRVQEFDANGVFVRSFATSVRPTGVAVDAQGTLYVATESSVQKFDATGVLLANWSIADIQGIALDPDSNIYLTNSLHATIHKLDAFGVELRAWEGNGNFRVPFGVSVGSDATVYVSDSQNASVQRFSVFGDFVDVIATAGTGRAEFLSPRGIATDANGNIYIVDSGNSRIQVLDRDGNFLMEWGSWCRMSRPQEGCVDPDGGGSQQLGDGQFSTPTGIAVGANGFVYVTDTDNNRVHRFRATGI